MALQSSSTNEKRSRIARAAVDVIGKKGFDRARMSDIACSAEVGKGTLYEYFDDKEDLLESAFEILMSAFSSQMEALATAELPPIETLRRLTQGTVRAMVDLGDAYRFLTEYIIHASREPLRTRALQRALICFRNTVKAVLERGVESGEFRSDLDVDVIAAAFAAWFDGAMFHWLVLPESTRLDEMAEQYIEVLLRGLLKRDADH